MAGQKSCFRFVKITVFLWSAFENKIAPFLEYFRGQNSNQLTIVVSLKMTATCMEIR